MLGKALHAGRPAKDSHDQIGNVTAKLEHHTAPGESQSRPFRGRHHFAHHGVHLEHFAQPALLQKFPQQYHSGVVAVHIPHLHHQLLLFGQIENALKLWQLFPCRLVDMHMLTCLNTSLGVIQQVFHMGFHQHCLKTRCVQQVIPGKTL